MTGSKKIGGFVEIDTVCSVEDKTGDTSGYADCKLNYIIDSDVVTVDIAPFGFILSFRRRDIAGIMAKSEIEREKRRFQNENV
ncbi:hypothetical protein [Eubacterium maltosivorans]|uniref:hypothetical protein n=1 Tax=Eubacterium maltosivorans TaxID=2041044 RepID=UPI00189E99A9|nr:hypothetical protein [Eubacterium maltosivorans]